MAAIRKCMALEREENLDGYRLEEDGDLKRRWGRIERF
jgi:hypothetical protein